MKKRGVIWDMTAALLCVAGVLLLAFSLGRFPTADGTEQAARRAGVRVTERMHLLDRYVEKAFAQDPGRWMDLSGLPDDMVVYRYVDDSLQSWQNRFPVVRDDIGGGVVFQRLTNPKAAFRSPLAEIGPDPVFCNLGSKWYLARSEVRGRVRVIAGLEIVDGRDTPFRSGSNARLRLDGRCTVRPLSYSGGSAVSYAGVPRFKLINEAPGGFAGLNGRLLWTGLLCLVFAVFCFLSRIPSRRRFFLSVPCLLAVMALFYFRGMTVRSELPFFSPTLYADGALFYSLAAVILINMALSVVAVCLFLIRRDLWRHIRTRAGMWLGAGAVLLACAGIVTYAFIALRSIVFNSAISLELYRFSELTIQSAHVYVSFILLLAALPLLLQLLQPLGTRLPGGRLDALSVTGRLVFAVFTAGFLVSMTSLLGFRKEQARLEVWANRLAVSRDIGLEVQLRQVEAQIASDPILASLSVLDNAAFAIQGRLSETFLQRVSQDYDIWVSVGAARPLPPAGEPVADNSHFRFFDNGDGSVSYMGLFYYRVPGYPLARVEVHVGQRGGWQDRGFSGILALAPPGRVSIPATYAFARYDGRKLLNFRGNYSYPLKMDDALAQAVYKDGQRHVRQGGHTHFIYVVSDGEAVIVSRPTVLSFNYVVALIFLTLVSFLLVSLFLVGRKPRPNLFVRNYFQSRIYWVMLLSLVLTLVAMATVSVYFVYSRGEANLRTMMSERIGTIQESLSARIRGAASTDDLRQAQVLQLLQDLGENTRSDITLYTPGGQVLMSTDPVVYDLMLLESRMDSEAYENIVFKMRRYFIKKERIGGRRFYGMYAPLLGESGRILAIICSPCTDEGYEFETNAVNHLILVISVFVFLLLMARFMTMRVLERMFGPLMDLARKMSRTDLTEPELVEYDKEDEISGLVAAYNSMVTELSESSKQLAQAERDKAWSGMARQVAHEIKNPLTPMKLQLQRLIRLKQRGDASWQEKFDEGAQVLLDHIDILTETANEFSTFAKLYTEEPTEIRLDAVLQEEIAMFDNRDHIQFSYMGLAGACVQGPKPQLTRVFVNLINNAVQAVEDLSEGRILVSLRNSSRDGYFDIVVEDNGPGVAPENVERLFTPNFTTKNGGSGLGLAISRSILERCGATISYSRSFSLGGACFTILYPK